MTRRCGVAIRMSYLGGEACRLAVAARVRRDLRRIGRDERRIRRVATRVI